MRRKLSKLFFLFSFIFVSVVSTTHAQKQPLSISQPRTEKTIQDSLADRDLSGEKDGAARGVISAKDVEGDESRNSAACQAAEPEGMDTFKQCSKDCNTVCSFEKLVDGAQCFKCQQGGDDTCADVGMMNAPHPWCEPGGICHADPMMYCTPPTAMTGPRRSKLTCTSCKQRPDMCWQKFDNSTTLTNCKLGCWNGTCEYRGKYTEKEWDASDDIIHCYECITPPGPPTCEELGWGYDWESGCERDCDKPDVCEEFLMTMGGPNDCCDEDAKDAADGKDDDGEDGEDDGKGTGTRPRGGNPWGPEPTPPSGSPWAPGGALDPNRPPTREELCKEVEGSLANPGGDAQLTSWEQQNQLKKMQRFQESLAALKEKAAAVDKHLKPMREEVAGLAADYKTATAELKAAKEAARGAENLGSYGETKLDELKTAQKKFDQASSHYSQAADGLKRQAKSFGRDVESLKHQAQKDLWQADPKAKQAETLERTEQYFDAWQNHTRLEQRREIADKVFGDKQKELQDKVDRGGSKAEEYQRQLDNLNREKKEWDENFDRQENRLAKEINRQQSRNASDGVGPYSREGLYQSLGDAATLLNGQINKINNLKSALEKAIKNNCPPENAAEILKSLEGKTDGLEEMIENLEARQQYADEGFPLSPEEQRQVAQNIAEAADSGADFDGVKSMWDFYAEEQANELARTFDPTDPSVRMKKAFWFTVGIVEGVGKAVKGLAELGAGAVDLIGETAAKYAGFEDGGVFGTDASDALQRFLGAADGNFNLDGLEKLSQVVSKSIDDYFTKMSKSTDLDKTTARAGGNVAGEFVLDYATGGLGKLRKGANVVEGAADATRAADKLNDAGRAGDKLTDLGRVGDGVGDLGRTTDNFSDTATQLGKGLDSGTGAAHAPPGVSAADDLAPTTKLSDGAIQDGMTTQRLPEGTIQDGITTQKLPEGTVQDAIGTKKLPEGAIQDGITTQRLPPGAVEDAIGTQKLPEGAIQDGITTQKLSDGAIQDGITTQRLPEGTRALDDGTPTFIDEKPPVSPEDGTPTFIDEKPGSRLPEDDMPTNLTGGTPQQPKVSSTIKSDSDLNFVDEAGQQVELKTGKQLGKGSTSTVYVDAANPDQVIRVTDMASTEVAEAVKLDQYGRKVVTDLSKKTDSVRVSEVHSTHTVQNQPGINPLNNKTIEIGENMKQGMAKDIIERQGGKMTEAQAQALDRATKELNAQGYAWLDAKPDNYTFETIPGTDKVRVVIVDPGGIVPMKNLDPEKATAIQRRINKPSAEFVETYGMTNNSDLKNVIAGEEWGNILKAHGDDIDINALGVKSVEDVSFNPSGNVQQPRVGELFDN